MIPPQILAEHLTAPNRPKTTLDVQGDLGEPAPGGPPEGSDTSLDVERDLGLPPQEQPLEAGRGGDRTVATQPQTRSTQTDRT